jgi:tetratricopeptide (TPR) repeat protein
MSKIGNALIKEPTGPRLTVVESIDDSRLEQIDYLVEPKESPFKVAVIALGAIAVLVSGVSLYRKYQARVAAKELFQKTVSYSENLEHSVQAFQSHDYDAAVRGFTALKEAHSDKKNEPLLLVNIGMAYKQKGDVANAKKSYEAAIQADPKYSVAYNNLAMLEAEQKDWTNAKIHLEKAIAVDPDQTAPIINLGKIYENSGKWAQAATYYSQYVDHPKADPAIKKLLQKRIQRLKSLSKEWQEQ